MENYVGKRLDGRYEIQDIIGVGGMAVVYKAYDSIDDRIVAIKVLKEEFLAKEEFRRRFKNESKAIAILSHPNIVKVYDVSFGDLIQYIVMEYVDGRTLAQFLAENPSKAMRERVFVQLLQAVAYMHRCGVVHNDIKLDNVLVTRADNDVRLIDFGLADDDAASDIFVAFDGLAHRFLVVDVHSSLSFTISAQTFSVALGRRIHSACSMMRL